MSRMGRIGWRSSAKVGLLYAGAIAVGYAMSWLRVPLPWMIGPMIFAGLVSGAGKNVQVPLITRPVGQTVVAGVVGLSFTPAAVVAVAEQIVPMIAVALLTILAGFLVARLLMRMTGIDVVSASLSSVPGGPVEMAALASRYGVAPGPVAFAQTMRIGLLVLIIPPLLVGISGGSVGQDTGPGRRDGHGVPRGPHLHDPSGRAADIRHNCSARRPPSRWTWRKILDQP